MKISLLPSAELLRWLFSYDAESGDLRWRNPQSSKMRVGDIAGWVHGDRTCRYVTINHKKFKVHRIIWKMVTGLDPAAEVDHRDGDGLNNRFYNLREASRAENSQNVRCHTDNVSGYKGVSFHKQTNKWFARIYINGVNSYLGLFCSPEEAHAVYRAAAEAHFGEFARLT